MKTAYVCPGQGAQFVGMGKILLCSWNLSNKVTPSYAVITRIDNQAAIQVELSHRESALRYCWLLQNNKI